jgi:hypothetical protein
MLSSTPSLRAATSVATSTSERSASLRGRTDLRPAHGSSRDSGLKDESPAGGSVRTVAHPPRRVHLRLPTRRWVRRGALAGELDLESPATPPPSSRNCSTPDFPAGRRRAPTSSTGRATPMRSPSTASPCRCRTWSRRASRIRSHRRAVDWDGGGSRSSADTLAPSHQAGRSRYRCGHRRCRSPLPAVRRDVGSNVSFDVMRNQIVRTIERHGRTNRGLQPPLT